MNAMAVMEDQNAVLKQGQQKVILRSYCGTMRFYNTPTSLPWIWSSRSIPATHGRRKRWQSKAMDIQREERRVILIFTIRSNVNFISFDTKNKLGFFDNPKCFNVANIQVI